jgi:hypothetical protein
MITIDNKPHKRTEYFRGSITLALSDEAQPSYTFELLRHTNGSIKYEVVIDPSYQLSDAHRDILIKTILANVAKEQVNWKPQEKEGKP